MSILMADARECNRAGNQTIVEDHPSRKVKAAKCSAIVRTAVARRGKRPNADGSAFLRRGVRILSRLIHLVKVSVEIEVELRQMGSQSVVLVV